MKNENGIACGSGKYNNFTGVIMWGKTEGAVENACFKLEEFPFMFVVFYSGVWENGVWDNGYLYGGTWHDGIWRSGVWKGGIWEAGDWEEGLDSRGELHLDSPNLWNEQK